MLRTESRKGPGVAGARKPHSNQRAGIRLDENKGPTPAPASAGQPYESRMSRIARRAHEIYEARGGQHGKAMDDWLQAEREVDAEIDAQGTR
jgi:Protein of unknown function (DUF2934)